MRPICVLSSVLVLFFQAEDGIRDLTVTGVQTCALPIFTLVDAGDGAGTWNVSLEPQSATTGARVDFPSTITVPPGGDALRSEERRVGKECRSRSLADQ